MPTPIYGLPFPDGTHPSTTWYQPWEDLALAVEAEIARLDTGVLEQASDNTTLAGITSNTFIAGSPVVGLAFVAPSNGIVQVIPHVRQGVQTAGGNPLIMSFELRAGNVVGSGTVIQAADDNLAVGGLGFHQGSAVSIVTGLTPGADYNVRTMHRVGTGATHSIVSRRITVIGI